MINLKKSLLFYLLAIILLCHPLAAQAYQQGDYCQVPMFLAQNVSPNVMVVLDNSDSMCGQAYATKYAPAQFTGGLYYGYFDGSKKYRYETSVNPDRWVETTAAMTTGTNVNPIASGSFLNWATMRRVEVAKKLLTGGKIYNNLSRSWNGVTTVKLEGETACGQDPEKDFDNSSVPYNPNLSPNTYPTIYPFIGEHTYSIEAFKLRITPDEIDSETVIVRPTSNIANGAWTTGPTIGQPAWDMVNETSPDDDNSYIQNKTSNTGDQVILGYATPELSGSAITSIAIVVEAQKSDEDRRMRIQGVVRVKTTGLNVDYLSDYENIEEDEYDTYSFTWRKNPATGADWTSADFTTSGVNSLVGFGVKAYTLPTSANYPRVTQIYLRITTRTATGGPYNIIVDLGTGKDAEGIIDGHSDKVRFGLAYYNSNGEGGHISPYKPLADCNVSPAWAYVDFGARTVCSGATAVTAMASSINAMNPSGKAPLAETLYEVTRYFRQDSTYYSSNDYTKGCSGATNGDSTCVASSTPNLGDPYFFDFTNATLTDEYVPCAKSFVLFLTDGESTADESIPGSSTSSPYAACSLTNIKACSGYGGAPHNPNSRFAGTSIGEEYSGDGTDYLIDVAYWARTNDMRPGTETNTPTTWRQSLPGTQNITLYPVYLFGRDSTLLKDAAIYGGFNDLDGDNRPDCTTIPAECYRDTDGDGVVRSNGTDDPLTYYEGDDGYTLKASIEGAVLAISEQASSGTSVSMLSTSYRGAGYIYQNYFLPLRLIGTRELDWTGYFFSLRIDEKGNFLDNNGKVVCFEFKGDLGGTHVKTKNPIVGGGNVPCDDDINFVPITKNVKIQDWSKYTWGAGELLKARPPDSLITPRKIITFVDKDNDKIADVSEAIDFDTANSATLAPFLDPDATATHLDIINFVRGKPVAGRRERTFDAPENATGAGEWKLGDIVNSTPIIVGNPAENFHILYSDSTYASFFQTHKARTNMIYVGANDGMLHAIKTDTGDEAWAYIPYNLLPHLKWLTRTDYGHVYYVDLKPRVVDINFSPMGTNGWKTLLIGGMRFGGGEIKTTKDFNNDGIIDPERSFKSAYFALDVTDPANPAILWEFTHPGLGFTTSNPGIAKVGNKWFVIIGSGPDSAYAQLSTGYKGKSSKPGKIFILDAANRAPWVLDTNYWILDTGTLNAFLGSPAVFDLDFSRSNSVAGILASQSYNSEVAYIGETFEDIAGIWRGNVWRLVMNGKPDPLNWSLSKLFDGGSFQVAGTNIATPITIEPSVSIDDRKNLWVHFGTGRFFAQDDKGTITKHAFFGIRDAYLDADNVWKNCWNSATGWKSVATYCSGATAQVGGTAYLYDSSLVDHVSDSDDMVHFTDSSTKYWSTFVNDLMADPNIRGWYRTFDVGSASQGVGAERSITKPVTISKFTLFTTVIPKLGLCDYGGTSNLYALYYQTGTPYKDSIIGITDGNVSSKLSLGVGLATDIVVHVGQDKATALIQTSTGAVKQIDVQLTMIKKSGFRLWNMKQR